MNFFKEYGSPVFLILIAIIILYFTYDRYTNSIENTNIITGTLSEAPKEIDDDGVIKIGFKISGYNDLYIFSGCLTDDILKRKTYLLGAGDTVIINIEKHSSSFHIPWSGSSFSTFGICQASSPKIGVIISFNQFKSCNDFKIMKVMPICIALLFFMGIFQLVRKLKDKQNKRQRNSTSTSDLFHGTKGVVLLEKPDKISYLLRTSYVYLIILCIGLYLIINNSSINYIGIFLSLVGSFFFIYNFFVYSKIEYKLLPNGIEITESNFLLQEQFKYIKFYEIQEVIVRIAFFEKYKNIGTIMIYTGEKDNDSNRIYHRLIGIQNPNEIANLIERNANLVDNDEQ